MGKSKASSKIKITNKSSNKRMKSKRKQKLNKSVVQTQVSTSKLVTKDGKGKHVISAFEGDEEIIEDELDEEMLEYINENSQMLLSSDLSNIDQRKRSKEKYAAYENVPRSFSKMSENPSSGNKVELLPFKGDCGLIQRSREKEVLPPKGEVEVIEESSTLPADINPTSSLSIVEILANHNADVNAKKLKIAHLSQEVIENPDKVSCLKELINLCGRAQSMSIRKLSLLSLVEVFKDIIPSYRIRELTEQEIAIKVSRDVCALREFENSLLSNYQMYLTVLEDNIKDCLKILKRKNTKGIPKATEVSLKRIVPIATISAQCLCELLKAVPHFNFRSNIISVVVPKIELSGELCEVGMVCSNGVKSAFIADKVGDVSLEIVKMVNRVVKSKVHVKPQLLEVLLCLQINTDAIKAAEEKGNKLERLRKKREAIMKMSKKEKKHKKVEDQLNKEMQEAEAVENRDRVERLQTEILKFLFLIYFRVLKADHITSLLPAVLQGLAKFSHLINVEFFHDLMVAMEKILKTEDVGLNESLNCIKTAVKILSGQGEILTIDPKQFYTELYSRLLFVAADGVDAEVAMAKSCVEDMLLKRRKQVSMVQVMGFFKRLATILLQLKSEDIVEYGMLVRNILQVHKKCDHLLDNDTCSRGIFQPEVPDPEYCNAESATLWELTLLSSHYHPHFEAISKHIMVGAPSQGVGSLPSKLLLRNPRNVKATGELEKYFPDFVPQKPTSKNSSNPNAKTWLNKTLETFVHGHMQSVVDCDMYTHNLLPTAKRKKCNAT